MLFHKKKKVRKKKGWNRDNIQETTSWLFVKPIFNTAIQEAEINYESRKNYLK